MATTLITLGSKKKQTEKNENPGAVLGMVNGEVPKDVVAVTERAAKKIIQLAEQEGKQGQALRVGVQGGGCSGLSYRFSFAVGPDEIDKTFNAFGSQVVVDSKSLHVLGGSVLDWQDSLSRSGFTLKNPNEKKNCSCGKSFSI